MRQRRGGPGGRRGGRADERDAAPGIRSFVAVLLPEEVRRRIDDAAAALRERAGAVAWVRVENLHVTLRFLGSVDEGTLRRVREALAEAAAGLAPFRLRLAGFGGFPSASAPRVVWAGVSAGAEPLAALHARVEAALARRGVPPEERAFHGHVTLGRARDPRGAHGIAALLGAPGESLGEMRVEAVHLMRSELDPRGARYSVLAREPLTGRAEHSPSVDFDERASVE